MEKETPEHQKAEHEIYEEELKDDPNATYAPCRNCKTEIRRKMRRCPYCGTLNPTVTVKEVMVTMVIMTIVLYIFTTLSV